MKDEELIELKREVVKDIDVLRRDYRSFKRRICTIANLFVPGIGFILYGSSYLKGFISFVLFVLYNLIYFLKLSPDLGELGFQVLYYIPAVVILVVSTVMVGGLDD